MSHEMALQPSDCRSAEDVQRAIDELKTTGGRVVLPELNLILDRGLELHSGITLEGQGERTILRKGPGRIYPLSGYHNYGMCDVPLRSVEGLRPGMTVSVLDEKRRGFYSTFARVTWVEGDWVGLDHGIRADYIADQNPRLTTAYPIVFGHGIQRASLRNLVLDGNLAENDVAMDGCRGGAVYFARSDRIEVADVEERNFNGEGISFQMCSRMRIRGSSFSGNTGNGLHPGAGSTDVLFENCVGRDNRRCGFFFCVRANHVTVRGCTFQSNGRDGVSIGTRDCHNLIEDCLIADNGGPGVCARVTPAPTEVHSCLVRRCRIGGNAREFGRAQIEALADAHDLTFIENRIVGAGKPGILAEETTARIYASANDFEDCDPDEQGPSFVADQPAFDCGFETTQPRHYRHLPQSPSKP